MQDLTIYSRSGKRVLFSHKELACKGTGTGIFAPWFGVMLRQLREYVGVAMYLTSCCRSYAYNASPAVNGHPRSLHVYDKPYHPTGGTCAADVRKQGEEYNKTIVEAAWRLGWSIGLANTFIHIDRRSDYTDLPQTVYYYHGYTGPRFDPITGIYGG